MERNKVEPLPDVEVDNTLRHHPNGPRHDYHHKEEANLENSELKIQKINISSAEDAKTSPKTKKCEKNNYKTPAFLNFGMIFGMDFAYYTNNTWSKRRIIKTVISLLFLLVSWVAFGAVLHKNYLCFLKRKSLLKPIQCTDQYVIITNLIDASFGAVCSLAFFTNRGAIAQLFYEALKPLYSENKGKSSQFDKQKVGIRRRVTAESVLLILLCIILPLVAVLAGIGTDLVMFFLAKTSKQVIEGSYVLANIPFVALSTYFCSMFSLICTAIQKRFRLLRVQVEDETCKLKYQDFAQQYQQCNGLVNIVEGIFSQILPILLTLRAMSVIVWLMYLSWEKGPAVFSRDFLFRYPTIALHLIQVLLLLIQPARLNNKLAMPVMVPACEKRSHWEIGIYTADMYKNHETGHYEFISRPAYVTAGGLRISAWFIVAILAVVSAFLWVEYNLSELFVDLRKVIEKGTKNVISAFPKPPPPTTPTTTTTHPPPTCKPEVTATAG